LAGSREGSKPVSLIEALEDYSSSHPESIAALCKWSARKFRRFYRAHQKRSIINALEAQKNQMVAALWANSNWDDTKEDKGHRTRAIEGINEQHQESIEAVELAFSTRVVPDEKKLADDNPFFAATDRGLAKVEAKVAEHRAKRPEHLKDGEEEEIDYMKGLDQE
jgi:hypothetical protein